MLVRQWTATTATGSVVLTGASGVMANAALSTLAAQASVSLINNKGDIGKVLQDMGSDETLKSLAFAVATAGVTAGIGNGVANSLFSTAPITPQQFAMLSTGTKVVTTATVPWLMLALVILVRPTT
ncbi:MAG: large exoprotein [Rickettsiaceae bacterium]|nr:large exoprotein [Rickettsiaceae bacterium]